jgi:ABC-type multidrug transport system fused ATPase/permease subunit
MRKKDIKGVQKKDPAAKDGKSNESEEEEFDEAEEVKKTRQGVVNLVGVDANRVGNFCSISHMMVGAAFRLGVAFTFLTLVVGWQSVLAGTATQLAFLPVNVYFSKAYNKAQDDLMKARDAKLAIVNEALTGIRQIKFAGLEDKWEKKILASRQKELDILWITLKADIALFFLWLTGPICLSAACIGTYAAIHGRLEPSAAFTTISILGQIEVTLSFLPELSTMAMDAWVSIKRIAEYLDTSEKVVFTVPGKEVSFDQATVSWPSESPDPDGFKLHDVTVTFPTGELSVISGRTGSGKSLMLSAILGEAELISGMVTVPQAPDVLERNDEAANKGNWILANAVAYVPQIPWIENRTFRDNICSGLPYDEERYNSVIEACALKKDLEILIDGDATEIGPKGINLSGGQCWRLTLARALYSRAGILIMDDIFSAVDAHVGRHIFENALIGDICKGRTRILVTHHVGLCRHAAKYEVQLGDGGVVYAGNIEDLDKIGALKTPEDDRTIATEDVAEDTLDKIERQISRASRKLSRSSTRPTLGTDSPEPEPVKQDAKVFVGEEERETGRVNLAMYKEYMAACGGWFFWGTLIALFIGFEALVLGRSWVLRLWTQRYEYQALALPRMKHSYVLQTALYKTETTVASNNSDDLLWYYLPLYLAVSLAMSIQGTMRFGLIFSGSLKASRKTFTAMTHTVLRAPLRWLDTVPTGRILNRFTNDFNAIDTRLAYGFTFTLWNGLQMIGVGIAG